MEIPATLLLALSAPVEHVEVSVPANLIAPADVGEAVPARLVASMAIGDADPIPHSWDYDFEPFPPCSFG